MLFAKTVSKRGRVLHQREARQLQAGAPCFLNYELHPPLEKPLCGLSEFPFDLYRNLSLGDVNDCKLLMLLLHLDEALCQYVYLLD